MTYSDGWSPGCVHSCPVSPVTTACADLSRLTIKPLSPIASASHVYKDLWFDKVMFFSALIWRGNPAGMSDLSQKWFNLAPNGTKHGYCQIIFQFQFILSRRAKVVHIYFVMIYKSRRTWRRGDRSQYLLLFLWHTIPYRNQKSETLLHRNP